MGEQEAFTAVIKKHEGVIFKITSMFAADGQDQKDLYQDIVYQLWKSFPSFKGEAKVSTWMYRVALNTAITQRNRDLRQPRISSIDQAVIAETDTGDTEFEDRIRLLYAHIRQLNDLEKGLILLQLEGKKYEEIAEITGLSPTNVGTRISRIKKKLQHQMSKK